MTPEDKFWAKVDKTAGQDACWPWRGGMTKDGYGVVHINGKHMTAHRVAYLLQQGRLTDGLVICHVCDNPPCCNPAHLFEGTHTENMHDALQKGHKRKGYHKPAVPQNAVRIKDAVRARKLQEFRNALPKEYRMKSDNENRSRPRFQGTIAPETAVILERVQAALGIRQPGRALDVLVASWSLYGCPEDLHVDVSDIDMQDYIGCEDGSISAGLAPLLMLVISFIAFMALSGLVTASNFLPVETWLATVQMLVR